MTSLYPGTLKDGDPHQLILYYYRLRVRADSILDDCFFRHVNSKYCSSIDSFPLTQSSYLESECMIPLYGSEGISSRSISSPKKSMYNTSVEETRTSSRVNTSLSIHK